MSSSTIAIVIACISGAVSLTAAFGVEWIRERSNKAKLAQDEELANLKLAQDKELEEFCNRSALAIEEARDQMTRGREAATKAEEAARHC